MRRYQLLGLVPLLLVWLEPWSAARAASSLDDPSRCLALALYWEAKTEGPDGMLAVASVVLNRVAHPAFPNSVCAVVTQGGEQPPCQFSWWCDGKSDRPTEPQAWSLAKRLARAALADPLPDVTRGALFFHNTSIATPWVRKRTRTVQIGRHVFYR
ncbi:MAG TPA: cell wall hydrolase [Geminicoccaceae bacterium]|nr:cell wall hydrolase [Geminicoccaceae bacterium]